jgi:hypothetical protein
VLATLVFYAIGRISPRSAEVATSAVPADRGDAASLSRQPSREKGFAVMSDHPTRQPVQPDWPTLSEIGSAHAPLLYFDEARTFGHGNGIIRITLEAIRLYSSNEGGVGHDRIVVAHLRMSVAAAVALKNALDGALLLANPSHSEARN